MKSHKAGKRPCRSCFGQHSRVGVVTVEMALVTPLLLVLLFGIIEFGLIFKDVSIMRQAAREGVRAAAVGATTDMIRAQVRSSAPTLRDEDLTIELKYRVYNDGWPAWESAPALGNAGTGGATANNAPNGAQIRVRVTYPHHLISGRLFSGWSDDPNGQIMTLTSTCTMRRE